MNGTNIFRLLGTIAIDGTQEVTSDLEDVSSSGKKAEGNLGKTFANIGKLAAKGFAVAASAAVGLGAAFLATGEATQETMEDLGKLEAAFTSAGHSAETGKDVFHGMVGVLGEFDQSVEAANHLAQLTDNQEELAKWTDIATGVYATFGDSLPLEGLTEAANETAKVGAVTGPLADALNWAGVSEEEFNLQLAACNSEQERATLITSTLNDTYLEASEVYKQVNGDLIEARQSQARFSEVMSEVGRVALPINTALKNSFSDLIASMLPGLEQVGEGIKGLLAGTEGSSQLLQTGLNDLINGLLTQITNALPLFLNIIVQVATALITGILNVLPQILNTIVGILPQITQAILNMLPLLITTLVQLIGSIITALGELLPEIVLQVVAILPLIIQSFIDAIPTLIEAAIQFFMAIIQAIPVIIEQLLVSLPQIIDTVILGLLTGLPLLINGAVQLLMALVDAIPIIIPIIIENLPLIITSLVNGLISYLPVLIQGAVTLFMALVKAIPIVIVELIKALPQIVTALIKGLTEPVKKLFSGLWTGIKSIFSGVGSWFKNIFSGAWNGIKSIWSGVKNFFSGIWTGIKNIFSGIGSWFRGIFQGAVDIVKNIWNGLTAIVKAPINFLIGGLNSFIKMLNKIKIPDWVPAVGGKGINLPLIPKLEEGGILAKGQTGFLEGNGAEAVVPLHNNKKWINAVADDMENAIGYGDTSNLENKLDRVIDLLLSYFPELANRQVVLSTGEVVGALVDPLDKALGDLADRRGRGK